jgi:ferredoxin
MAKYKMELVKEECTACESCTEECPDHFEMGDDELSHIKGSTNSGGNDVLELDDIGCAKDAADNCPVNCIHIYDGGNKIV